MILCFAQLGDPPVGDLYLTHSKTLNQVWITGHVSSAGAVPIQAHVHAWDTGTAGQGLRLLLLDSEGEVARVPRTTLTIIHNLR